jgi:uncharacterized protein YcbK (DUF882 family)
MDTLLFLKLDDLRGKLNLPLVVTSGFRCPKHNKEVGGKPNSYHLVGKAVDISTEGMNDFQRHQFLSLVKERFKGIGIGHTFIHMDLRETPALWVYK